MSVVDSNKVTSASNTDADNEGQHDYLHMRYVKGMAQMVQVVSSGG